MPSAYDTKHKAHLANILNRIKGEVLAFDLSSLIQMKKKLSKQMSTGASLSLVTVDNQHAAIIFLNKLIAEKEEALDRRVGQVGDAEDTPVDRIMEALQVSREEATRILKKYGDPYAKLAGTALEGNTDTHYLDEDS